MSSVLTPPVFFRGKENGFHERPPVPLEPAAKRICTISPAPRHSPAHPLPLSTQLHPTPPPLQHYALDDIAAPHILHREHSQRMLEIRELKDRPRLPGTWCTPTLQTLLHSHRYLPLLLQNIPTHTHQGQ